MDVKTECDNWNSDHDEGKHSPKESKVEEIHTDRQEMSSNASERIIWKVAEIVLFLITVYICFHKIFRDQGINLLYIRFSSTPYAFLMGYVLVLIHHVKRIYQKSQEKNRHCIQCPKPQNFWYTFSIAHMKFFHFLSCCYLIYVIEDFDGHSQDFQNFPRLAAFIVSIHICIFLLKQMKSGSSEINLHMFKYVPVLPSALLTMYTIDRCFLTDGLWDVVKEHIGMLLNNILLIHMFIYQDFFTYDIFATNRIDFVGDENPKTKKFYQYLEEKDEMKWYTNKREEDLSKFSKFDRKSYEVIFPTCLLIMNSFLMWLIAEEPDDFVYFCFGLTYILCTTMVLLMLSMPMERSCFFAYLSIDVLPLCYLTCYFSLWSEMPEMDGKTSIYGLCSNYLSAPAFYLCILLFLYQIRRDYKNGRLHNAFNYSRSLHYYLTLRTPDMDWKTICRNLAYVNNIEDFDVRVDAAGGVTLESKSSKELRKNKSETDEETSSSTAEDEVENLSNGNRKLEKERAKT